MVKITDLAVADALDGSEKVPIVQNGESKRASLGVLAGSAYRKVATYEAREAIPMEERSAGLRVMVMEGTPRVFEWVPTGTTNPITGAAATSTDWVGLYTIREMKNLGIDFFGTLPAANVEALPDAVTAVDALSTIEISDFQAIAQTSGTNPKTALSWAIKGMQPTSLIVSWGASSIVLAGTARGFLPKDWGALKPLFIIGNSLSDTSDRTDGWAQLVAADRSVGLYSAARYSSDPSQVYRCGAASLYLTLAGGVLPTGGTSASVSLINGAAPSADLTVNPASFLNTGDPAIVTNLSMAGTIVAGTYARRGTVSIPNGASTAYSIVQDAGGAAIPLTGPVLFIPDLARQMASSDLLICTGNNNFYSGVPNTYGDHTNPQLWVDLAKIVAKAEGNRVLMLPVIPDSSWPTSGAGNQYAAMQAANARTEALYPAYIARDAAGRTLLQRLQAAGNGSANDNADIAAGFVPRSLHNAGDTLHLNSAGQAVVAAFVKEALARQALPSPITQSTAFTLHALGTNPRTGAALEHVAVATVQTGELALLADQVSGTIANSEYRTTLAEAVADLAVGTYFSSRDAEEVGPHHGTRWNYRRIDTAPYWEALDVWAQAQDVGLGDYPESPTSLPVSGPQQAALDDLEGGLLDLINRHVSPEQFGTSADWPAALEACAAAAQGGPILFRRGATYVFNRPASIAVDLNIDLNGATIIAPTGFVSAANKTSYTAGAYFTVNQGDHSFAVPSGMPIAAGQWLRFESATLRQTTGNYYYGEYVEVIDVTGGIATVREPFVDTYQVDRIYIQAIERVRIVNGIIDMTSTVAQPSGQVPYNGVSVTARRVKIDLDVRGSAYVGKGVDAYGVYVNFYGTATGITNIQAYSGGRLGYGFSVSASYCYARVDVRNCKHGFVGSDRQVTTKLVYLDNFRGSSPKGEHNNIISPNGTQEALYQGVMDVHSNVRELIAFRPMIKCVNSAMMLRGRRHTIISPDIESYGCTGFTRQNYLIYVGEEVTAGLVVRDAKVRATHDTTLTGAATPWLVGIIPDYANSTYGAIDVDGVDADNVGLFSFEILGTAANQSIGDVSFKNVRGTLIGGLVVGGTGAALTSTGKLTLEGNFTLGSPNNTLRPALLNQNVAAFGPVSLSGKWDCTALTATNTAPVIYGRNEGLTASNSGSLGDFDISRLYLKAYNRGIEIGSTSATAPGLFRLTGMVEYNIGNASTASGIRLDLATAPVRKAIFRGADIRNKGATNGTSTPAVTFINVGYSSATHSEFSGITVNDAILPTNQATQPIGIKLDGLTEILWRSSGPNIYLDQNGRLTADTIPTTGAFPAGTLVWARTPTKGAPLNWQYTSSGWTMGAGIPNVSTGAPTTTPTAYGLTHINSSTGKVYISTGTSTSADWSLVN